MHGWLYRVSATNEHERRNCQIEAKQSTGILGITWVLYVVQFLVWPDRDCFYIITLLRHSMSSWHLKHTLHPRSSFVQNKRHDLCPTHGPGEVTTFHWIGHGLHRTSREDRHVSNTRGWYQIFTTPLLRQRPHHHGRADQRLWCDTQARRSCQRHMIWGLKCSETMAWRILESSHTRSSPEGAEAYGLYGELSRAYLQS